jgi:hypothetical protein
MVPAPEPDIVPEFFVLDKLNSLARQRSASGDTIAASNITRVAEQ